MKREEKRELFMDAIPAWYDGRVHFLAINLVGLIVMALSWALLDQPRIWEWAAVPLFIVFANFVEWWVHQGWMHHPSPYLMWPYLRHATEHHVIFTDKDMEVRHPRELYHVLAHPLFYPVFIAVGVPVPLLAGWLVSWNLAVLFALSVTLYYVIYEWFHTVHHWPTESRVGRSLFARLVREHHRIHHDPKLMTRGNFNVSFPLADRVLKTVLPTQ